MTLMQLCFRPMALAGVCAFFMFAPLSMSAPDQPATDQPDAKQPAEKTECQKNELDAAKVKESLRHWRGLAAFSHWHLAEVRTAECIVDGRVKATLVLAPPSGWSHFRVPYLVQASLDLNPEGKAFADQQRAGYATLAKGVRRLVLRAEANEDVRRFIERFPPDRAKIESVDGSEKLRVTFVYSPGKDGGRGHPVRLTFSEALDDGEIVAYDLPRIDSLPVRRELLSFAVELSARIPSCQPSWISARFESLQDTTEDHAGRWKITAAIAGNKCPEKFELALEHDPSNDSWMPLDATRTRNHADD